jgi:putative protein-disulfide isomerase
VPRRILYFADPMCSWCWGFSPVIAAIQSRAAGRASVRVVVGGLRVDTDRAMDDRQKASIRRHWEEVSRATGQPFDFGFFDRSGFVYDTEPACRAVVAVRSLAPNVTLGYFRAVQNAFYAENRDVTAIDTLADLARASDVDGDAFASVFSAPEVVDATRADFTLAATIGVGGFPSVILQDDTKYAWLTQGYQPLANVAPQIDHWLSAAAAH